MKMLRYSVEYKIIKDYVSLFLYGACILIVGLLLLNELTSFEIKSQLIKSFTYLGVLICTPMTLIWNLWSFKRKEWKVVTAIPLILIIIGIFTVGPMQILFSSASWKTQSIIYENQHFNFKKVEFQMQDVGAFGYNKRTVEVTYLTSLFMIVHPVEKDIDKRNEWIKIDKEINELGLKFP